LQASARDTCDLRRGVESIHDLRDERSRPGGGIHKARRPGQVVGGLLTPYVSLQCPGVARPKRFVILPFDWNFKVKLQFAPRLPSAGAPLNPLFSETE